MRQVVGTGCKFPLRSEKNDVKEKKMSLLDKQAASCCDTD